MDRDNEKGQKPDKGDEPETHDEPDKGKDDEGVKMVPLSISRKHEDRAEKAQKEVDRLTQELRKLEDRDKSESEKLTDKVKELEAANASLTAEVGRLRIGMRKGLSETQAKRLVGSTEAELEADAEELIASWKPAGSEEEPEGEKSGKDNARPKERLKPGASGDSEPEETDPKKLAENIPRLS